ncbi:HtaA domain-containing protein [Streptomyces sp. NBC_01351]|uniref:HtaA domain-containing protein n=1 Tax=Streptomyces sp. NBC_01351 TaxID=2903833 RepID=UPI002E358E39|nr:HtaA domain-containing protein [Streptomyces sp. NBC_01351]
MLSHRRPIALAAAVLTAAALGATALALPATAADGPPAAPVRIVGGTLDWGVLASYRAYVTGMAHGTITVADGARQNEDGSLRFGEATGQYEPAAGHVVKAAFRGSVTFSSPAPPTGHGFEVKLSDFRIDSGTKKVTADVTKGGATTQDVPLAAVAFTGPATANLATTLTKAAADALGSPSYENRAGDPLTAKLEFEQPPVPTKSPSPSPTRTKPTPTPTKTAAATTKPPVGGPQKILSGKLTWGVKESFRRYVLSGGTITPSGGAAKNGELFDFALGKGELDVKRQKLNATFAGSLRFQYAAHGIDMTFGDVRVEATGKTGTLYVNSLPFATLDLSKTDYKTQGGVLALNAVPAAFTAKGAALFANGTTGSMYKAGDPITLSVAVDKDAALPASGGTGGTAGGAGTVGGNLAATGADIPAGPLLATSGTVVAAGARAVFLARRRRTNPA